MTTYGYLTPSEAVASCSPAVGVSCQFVDGSAPAEFCTPRAAVPTRNPKMVSTTIHAARFRARGMGRRSLRATGSHPTRTEARYLRLAGGRRGRLEGCVHRAGQPPPTVLPVQAEARDPPLGLRRRPVLVRVDERDPGLAGDVGARPLHIGCGHRRVLVRDLRVERLVRASH